MTTQPAPKIDGLTFDEWICAAMAVHATTEPRPGQIRIPIRRSVS
jgi:hypothetical protein